MSEPLRVAQLSDRERLNRETKRRADVVGIFTHKSAVTYHYMPLETLARIDDTDPIRLPAMGNLSARSLTEERRS
ncbi:MAG: hypothetical protein AAF526_07600 [Pseudomonadota bacterium]